MVGVAVIVAVGVFVFVEDRSNIAAAPAAAPRAHQMCGKCDVFILAVGRWSSHPFATNALSLSLSRVIFLRLLPDFDEGITDEK